MSVLTGGPDAPGGPLGPIKPYGGKTFFYLFKNHYFINSSITPVPDIPKILVKVTVFIVQCPNKSWGN